MAACEGIADSVVGNLRAARRGSVGGQSQGRDGEDWRPDSRSRQPDADRTGGGRAGGTWAYEPGGGAGAVLEREHRRGESSPDLSEARGTVADRTVAKAPRAVVADRSRHSSDASFARGLD